MHFFVFCFAMTFFVKSWSVPLDYSLATVKLRDRSSIIIFSIEINFSGHTLNWDLEYKSLRIPFFVSDWKYSSSVFSIIHANIFCLYLHLTF